MPKTDRRQVSVVPIDGSAPRALDLGGLRVADNAIAIHPDGAEIAVLEGDPVRIQFRVLEGVTRPASAELAPPK